MPINSVHAPAQQPMSSEPDWSAVRAALRDHNAGRVARLRKVRNLQNFGWVAFGAICSVGLWISYLRGDPEIFFATLVSAFLAVMPFFMVMVAKQRLLQTDLYIAILPLLLPALDKWSIVTRKPAPQIARMPGHYFVPREETDCDFHIEGSLHGVPFSVTQAVLSHSPGDAPETTFCGLIVWTQVSNGFPGDFSALRRPNNKRSLWRGTVLPERLMLIPNTMHLGRCRYDLVTTDLDSAMSRLPAMASAIDTLLTLGLDDLPQVAVSGSDAFILLSSPRFGWDADKPVPDLDVERHIQPFASTLWRVFQALDPIRRI